MEYARSKTTYKQTTWQEISERRIPLKQISVRRLWENM